jgi:hypothetical protein
LNSNQAQSIALSLNQLRTRAANRRDAIVKSSQKIPCAFERPKAVHKRNIAPTTVENTGFSYSAAQQIA